MLRLLGLLLVIWLVVTIAGAVFAVMEGLFWLAVIGALLFVATAALGWRKRDRKALPRGW
jgi:hypothetical protein